MFHKRRFVISLIAACLFGVAPAGSMAQQEATKLVGVLNSDASLAEKAMACRRLAVVGDARSVPALANLLADEQLATYARSGLEGIADKASDDALQAAARRLKGKLLIGVLDSIGRRRDPRAIETLVPLLASEDRTVAAAAARALGYIGSSQSAEILLGRLNDGPKDIRLAIANACLICAQQRKRDGGRAQAIAIYNTVREADLPEHLTLAATHRVIIASGEDGLPLLKQLLASEDKARFRFGLQVARDLGDSATGILIDRIESATATQQTLLVIAMGDTGDPKAIPALIAAVIGKSGEVRLQAIATLGKFPTDEATATLLKAALSTDDATSAAALDALSGTDSSKIVAAVTAMLASGDEQQIRVGIALAEQHHIGSATPALLKLIDQANSPHRLNAIKALGATVGTKDLHRLIALAISKTPPGNAVTALTSACARLPREETAVILASTLANASLSEKQILLNQLAVVGGSRALQTIADAASSDSDALQNLATQLLGRWETADVAPVLLSLTKNLPRGKYKIRVLRGYLRVARQLNMPTSERVEICRSALALAERSEEKILALQILQRYPTADGLAIVASLLASSQLGTAAAEAVVAMAPTTAPLSLGATQNALKRVIADSNNRNLRQRAEQQLAETDKLAASLRDESQFVTLFDGKTLDGWHGNEKIFRVEDGQIVGGSLKRRIEQNEFLRSNKQYGDFELRLQFKLLGTAANGGVQIRTQEIPNHHEVSGYQADLGDGWWGCLYDESRRNRVLAGPAPKRRADPVRREEWNDYRILCQGNRIRLWVNGIQTVDYTEQDPKIPSSGIIAVQVHGNLTMEGRYRNIRIKELGK